MKTPRKIPIRILLVDDHEVVRSGLKVVVARCPDVEMVAECGSARAVSMELERCRPNLILLDLRLKDGNGFEVCRRLKAQDPALRVLILSAYADESMILNAAYSGADGYVLKEIDSNGLQEAIRAVAWRKRNPRRRAAAGRPRNRALPAVSDPLSLLSGQEQRVMELVSDGLSNKEISMEMGLTETSIKNYLRTMLDDIDLQRLSPSAYLFG